MEIHKRHEGLALYVSRVRCRVAYTACTIDDIVTLMERLTPVKNLETFNSSTTISFLSISISSCKLLSISHCLRSYVTSDSS